VIVPIAILVAVIAIWLVAARQVDPTRRKRREWQQERLDLNPCFKKRQAITVIRGGKS
jgi:hypothetical protein